MEIYHGSCTAVEKPDFFLKAGFQRILEMNKLVFELREKHQIENTIFANVANAKYAIPTHWNIGKIYK